MQGCFSHIQLLATPWTVASRLLCPWNFPGKNIGAGCHALLHGIFLTQESNPCLLHWQADSLPSEPPGKLGALTIKIVEDDASSVLSGALITI